MVRHRLFSLTLVLTLSTAAWAVKTNDPAPDFSVKDTNGKTQALSQYRGKYVVLEWHNKGCPFVRKHYESKNMQKLQKELTGKDLVWLTVISSAKGKQGYMEPAEAERYMKEMGAAQTAVLLDTDGKVGTAYDARTTPHMYVIDPKGKLIYQGAIDSNSSADPATIAGAKNYVVAALTEARAGKKVTDATTEPYGCSVKYE